jgi:lambda repressor-like predicted transcriptional regulator
MENWLPVVGFESLYEVSDQGHVQRIAGWCDGRKRKFGVLSSQPSKRGYCKITLFNARKKSYVRVHKLVMAAFIGPLPLNHAINHKNGVKHDNRLENLEYVTHSENTLHMYHVLKVKHFRGSEAKNAKISEDEAIAMRVLRRKGWKLKQLAELFGLSASSICWICKNKTWKHV